jgi:hypothetical protein
MRLELVTSIPPVRTEHGELAGIAIVPAADVLRLFRRCGTGPAELQLRRLADPATKRVAIITDPAEGITIATADLLITRREVERFEEDCGLLRKEVPTPAPSGSRGRQPAYEWDAFWSAVVRMVHDRGLPERQEDLVRDLIDWFESRGGGAVPDESTIRKKIKPLWQEMRG